MKKSVSKIIIAALAAATLTGMMNMNVFAVNSIITDGTWIGSDAATTGTAIRTKRRSSFARLSEYVKSFSLPPSIGGG